MNKEGPIIIIEDDEDDRDLLSDVFNELGYPNKVEFFATGQAALDYLSLPATLPFLIISDVNMPMLNGFELKQIVQNNEKLRKKCIPYLFFSTSVSPTAIEHAFAMSVQGFFLKPPDYDKLKSIIRSMLEYWKECYSPESS